MRFLSDPGAIEARSFVIIDRMIAGLPLAPEEKAVVQRVIHTTGDPEYAHLVHIHPEAIVAGVGALARGCAVCTDVKMVKAGINTGILAGLGGRVNCLIDDESVVRESRERGVTRAAMAMRIMAGQTGFAGEVVAVGNAPTALFTLAELIREGRARPALVVATAVGFVGAGESKEAIEGTGLPSITVRGTKGGSAVAAAVVNALLIMVKGAGDKDD